MAKRTKRHFLPWACLFVFFLFFWFANLLVLASSLVEFRFTGKGLMIFAPAISLVASLSCLLLLFSFCLKGADKEKAFERFRGFYWLFAFISLVVNVFLSVYVLPQLNWVHFVEGKGFDYVLAYLIATVFGGITPFLFLLTPKKGGQRDGGTI
jgi:hypothetical protein